MSRHNFEVKEHVLPCSYIRGFARATHNDEEDVLQMHIKCYSPLSNARWEPYDVTFIAAHANGVGKELYEPLWDELLAYSRRTKKFRIRSIWIADVAHQGQSGVLNEGKLGDDPSWHDHPRDLFLMINHFRKAMPQPIVGIGHSMGGNNIAKLALMHPRLFTSVVLLDPVIKQHNGAQSPFKPAAASTFRRDLWPSREAARKAFAKNPFYQSWDSRAFDLWIEYGLRELPTELYPEGTVVPPDRKSQGQGSASAHDSRADKPVTLTTTKHQEVFTFLRSKHPAADQPLSSFKPTRKSHPDLGPEDLLDEPFYLAPAAMTYNQLPHLRPSCLYLLGSTSELIPQEETSLRLATTGTGIDGSGGVAEDQVRQVSIEDGGHFFPFQKPAESARQIGLWLDERIPVFRKEQVQARADWEKVKGPEKSQLNADRLWWTKRDVEMSKAQARQSGRGDTDRDRALQKLDSKKSKI